MWVLLFSYTLIPLLAPVTAHAQRSEDPSSMFVKTSLSDLLDQSSNAPIFDIQARRKDRSGTGLTSPSNCWVNGLMPVAPLRPARQLKQLTASPCLPTSIDFGDPSSPRMTDNHTISVYGSGHLEWQGTTDEEAWDSFLAGEMPNYTPISLFHPDGTELSGPLGEEEAWDVTVETFPKLTGPASGYRGEAILFGGAMPQPSGKTNATFGQDNENRRTYSFHLSNGKWLRDQKPLNSLFPDMGWLGHNYGHEFITGADGTTWMFYERVSEVTNNGPTKTEIFARKFTPPSTLSGPEIQIFKIPQTPYPSVVRDNGNTLAEGPRPFAVKLNHQIYYLVSFSSSDWGSDHYGINLLWSRSIDGPYEPILNAAGNDLEDFGAKIRKDYSLTYGPGRGVFFQDAKRGWWVMFHAANRRTQINVQNPVLQGGLARNFFLAPVKIELRNGAPVVQILDRD